MRRALSVALALLVGATVLTACSSDPTPTDVKVAWAPKGRPAVLVTWKDNDQPNRVTIEGVLSESPGYVKYIPAGDPNHWEIPTSAFPPDGNYKVAVGTGTSQGGVSSKLAHSEVFDTDGPILPNSANAVPKGRGIQVNWSLPRTPQDFTPNDPLDVKGRRTQSYVPMIGRPGQIMKVIGPATTSTKQVVKSIKPPYLFQLRTQNEWTSRNGAQVLGLTSSVNVIVPTLAQFGVVMRARGRVILQETVCDPETKCALRRATPAGVPVTVRTQITPTSRWTQVARGATSGGGYYDIGVPAGASRPYLATVPPYTKAGLITGTSVSKLGYTKTVARVTSAGFLGGETSKKVRTSVTAVVGVSPAMNTSVVLQVWNPQTRKWTYVKTVPMRKGQASYAFLTGKSPGDFTFRYVVPGASFLGRPMSGTTTKPMALHVR
ncbi:hypothetical protein [Kribbella sp. NPDC055071]